MVICMKHVSIQITPRNSQMRPCLIVLVVAVFALVLAVVVCALRANSARNADIARDADTARYRVPAQYIVLAQSDLELAILKEEGVRKTATDEGPRRHVILDLDATLVHSVPTAGSNPEGDASLRKAFESHTMGGAYTVHERPHLQEFLDFLFANFTVSVWTAAATDYARFVLERVVLGGALGEEVFERRKSNFYFFWSRPEYQASVRLYSKPKTLEMVWDVVPGINAGNSILLDDLEENGTDGNFMLVPAFSVSNPNAKEDDFFQKKAIPSLSRMLLPQNGGTI